VNSHDDGQFESYLKRFRPHTPDPLPRRPGQHPGRPQWLPGAWAAVVAAVALALTLSIVSKRTRSPQITTVIPQIANSQPLTIGDANGLLAQSSSTKAALDHVAFPSRTTELPRGRQSVLSALGKEDKL
jgi:hypothetical protein